MMFERFTPDARTVVVHAQQHSHRLGHRYIGCEHLLLALVGTDTPASAALGEQGLTPERVEEEIVHRVGLGAGAGLFADLDRDALAAIGVDLDAVRARIEASVGSDALTRASQALHRAPRSSRLNPRRAIPPGLIRRWRRWRRGRRPALAPAAHPAPATGRYQAADVLPTGYVPFTPRAKRTLENSQREALSRHDAHIGVEHIALVLLASTQGTVPVIVSALGASAPALRSAIADRYRQAS